MCSSSMAMHVLTQASGPWRPTITLFRWAVIPRPPGSPDLAPSDYHLFGPMKEGLRGNQYGNDIEVKTVVLNWLRHQPAELQHWYKRPRS